MQPRKQFQQFQKLGDKIFRVPRVEPWRIPLALVRVPRVQTVSVAVVIWGFAVIIAVGAVLLMLPISSRDQTWTSFPNALFMATSATCVTGLSVVDCGTHFSGFGQGVLLVLMQVGGFGFMSSATLLLLAFGRSVGLREKLVIAESMGVEKLGGLLQLLLGIAFFSLACEGLGAVLLYIRFSQVYPSPETAIWQAIFHAVSAFNNCGLDILGTGRSFEGYHGDGLVVLTIAGLIILGGLSFLVVWDIFKTRSFSKLSLDSKMVVVVTAVLLILGTCVLLATEYNNQATLGSMSGPQKVLDAFFHSVTPRTAGFNVVRVGWMTAYSLFFTIMLMFIGGASGSTAGGIKINTFGVLLGTVWSSLRGRQHAEAFGREMRPQLVHRALAIAMLSLGLVGVVTLVLTVIEVKSEIRWTPDITVGRTPEPAAVTAAGQVVYCTYSVANGDKVTLTEISVNDPACDGGLAYQSGDEDGDGELDAGETWVYSGQHTVTQEEADLGSLAGSTVTVEAAELTRPAEFMDILFETVSAFGTVGLSTGLTPFLSLAGKLIIVATMFAGRLGPLTLALSLVQAQRTTEYRYPHDQVRIG